MKVVKFGGSSMADAGQYRKIREILLADPERKVVVVSAAGKRNKNDHKITDLLYLCHAHTQYGVDCSGIFEMIVSRYLQIRDELGIQLDLESEFAALKQQIDARNVTQDELASRGEYFSAKLMAAYLGFRFIDAADWVKFNFDGTVDQESTYEALRSQVLLGSGAVIPGFYGLMPDGRIRTFTRGGSDITGALAAAALLRGKHASKQAPSCGARAVGCLFPTGLKRPRQQRLFLCHAGQAGSPGALVSAYAAAGNRDHAAQ